MVGVQLECVGVLWRDQPSDSVSELFVNTGWCDDDHPIDVPVGNETDTGYNGGYGFPASCAGNKQEIRSVRKQGTDDAVLVLA